jgi:hypothetical protein
LLAFVSLVTDTDLNETIELLKRAVAKAPGRNDLLFMLAQLYMRKEDFKTARQLVDKLASGNDEEFRQRSQGLLTELVSMEEQLARIRAKEERANNPQFRDSRDENGQPVIIREIDPASILRESLRKPAAGETQTQGSLVRIDCDARGGITFVLRINEQLLKLSTDSFRNVSLMSFSEDAGGQVTCGPRKPENNVVVAYLASTDPRPKFDGVIKSIEFVPPDFQLKAGP